jgi:signal peptidase I
MLAAGALVLGCIAAGTLALLSKGSSVKSASLTGALSASGQDRLYKIPSGSMEPTLPIDSRVIVEVIGASDLHIGTIVAFHPPAGAAEGICGPTPHLAEPGGAACSHPIDRPSGTTTFFKRMVAGPSDWLYIEEGHVYLSTKGSSGPFLREHDPYIRPCGSAAECNFPTPIEVPPKDWFLMGDNRGDSEDSRFYGPVPTSWIVGRVVGQS